MFFLLSFLSLLLKPTDSLYIVGVCVVCAGVCAGVYGCVWTYVGVCGCGVRECVWYVRVCAGVCVVCAAVGGSVRVCAGVCVHMWEYGGVYGCACV